MAVLAHDVVDSLADETLPRKKWTRAELLLVEETGVFEGAHFELIHGELIDKMGKNYPHVRSTRETVIALELAFGQAFVIHEAPIDVAEEDNARNEPEPDVIALRNSFRNIRGNAQPSGIALLVEIADTTLRQDLTTKAKLYARAGIGEYWVLNLNGRRLHVFREPSEGVYAVRFELGEGDFVSPAERPGHRIAVATLLG